MLRLRFLNVGDGDAIFVEEMAGPRRFRMLVDTGPADVAPAPGSQRITAAEYLKSMGVTWLDTLVITHLHTDHFGGLGAVMDTVDIGTVYSGFFPAGMGRALAKPQDSKSIRGLTECLNLWSEYTAALERKGTCLCPITRQWEEIVLTQGLRAVFYGPPAAPWTMQNRVWQAMLRGEEPSGELKYCTAKLRNPCSLRLALLYAGRRIELPGDCYGAVWEDQAQKSDLLKVPHHGDPKALTKTLLSRMDPEWAVISCGEDYIPRKDRPSRRTLELLKDQGTRVWFTDAYAPAGGVPARHRSVDFFIYEDGSVLTPA